MSHKENDKITDALLDLLSRVIDFQSVFDDGEPGFCLDDVIVEGLGGIVEFFEDSFPEVCDNTRPENETHPKQGIDVNRDRVHFAILSV